MASCVEHVQRISIDVQLAGVRIADSFEWDLSNPDNSPEEFASMLVADQLLENYTVKTSTDVALLEKAVAQEIRRKLDLNCLTHASLMKHKVESINPDDVMPL